MRGFLFDHEKIQEAYGKEKYEEGFAAGLAEVKAEARANAIAKGAALMSKLAILMIKDGRIDEVERAGADENFRNALLKEYML